MLLQSQLKFKDNMLQVADLNLTEALGNFLNSLWYIEFSLKVKGSDHFVSRNYSRFS